ncbi:MAG TPA: NAD-dependent epimerase/dehydratase family protein [Thermoanaerobaculia bacterium]|nr:NAD-dependent epimerase/dehydratase family protein [Thermoanaerobaculia bacterium]
MSVPAEPFPPTPNQSLPGAFEDLPVLVTGGAGFVGSMLSRACIAAGARVTVLDDFFTGREENLPASERLRVVRGCVTDPTLLKKLVAEAKVVFHLAARNIIASIKDPKSDFLVNAGGTLAVLQAVREAAEKDVRVVYSSSASVYGNPRHLPIGEEDPPTCLSPYAASKLAGELYCRVFYEQYGLRVAVVRYSNVFGVGQSPTNPYCGVISKFLVRAEQGEELLVHGDGLQTRDFTYVDDAVAATIQVAGTTKAEGEVFNVGTGIETTMMELIALLSRIYGRPLRVRHVERRDIDNVRRRVMNIEKIRSRIRWTPGTTLESGLRRTIEWIRAEEKGEASGQVG